MTLVHNDPVNLMSYVTYVFQAYFGYPKDKAHKLMLDVHQKGRAVVSSGSREEMERDVQAMHGYGLWAGFPTARDRDSSRPWRIAVFYVGALIMILSVVPWSTFKPGVSPFVKAFEEMGLGVGAAIVNL
ncbi:ATP-dependent Clp protease adapter protein ClpS [Streptomyces microflavus]